MSKMVKVTYQGDGTNEPTGEVGYQGQTFHRGEPVEIDASTADGKAKLEAFKTHPHFAVAGEKENPEEDDVSEDAEILALRKQLDQKGVAYRANASLASLRKLTYATPNPSPAGTVVDAPHPVLATHGPATAHAGVVRADAYTGKTDPETDAATGKKAK